VSRSIARLRKSLRGRGGQGLVEYALILALVTLVVLVALTSLHHSASNVFDTDSNAISSAISSTLN